MQMNPDVMKKMIELSDLPLDQLQQKCNSLNIDFDSQTRKSELIRMLATPQEQQKQKEQTYDLSQGIPLRSKYPNGQSIPNAGETYKKWRILSHQAHNNLKEFKLQNKEGKEYTSQCFYIECTTETALFILNNKWYAVYESQIKAIKEIKNNPDKFEFNIIVKTASNGNNFLMLHTQLKENN